jgi:hypothetical protein
LIFFGGGIDLAKRMGLHPYIDLQDGFREWDLEIEPLVHDPFFDAAPPEDDPAAPGGHDHKAPPEEQTEEQQHGDEAARAQESSSAPE